MWYNVTIEHITERVVVVPRWFLVWYNRVISWKAIVIVVVPRWFLVWYNIIHETDFDSML